MKLHLKTYMFVMSISRKLDKDETSGFMSLANLIVGMIYDVQGKRQYAINAV